MTCKLVLTRHAKSSWEDPLLDDFDRPLNGRGRKSAKAIGKWLREHGHVPNEVLVSGARRTVDTWGQMASKMPADIEMRSEPVLFHSSAETMLRVLQGARAETVMMIAHNPGICDFAARLVSSPPDHARFHDYPSAATTVMQFDIDRWEDLSSGTGQVQGFVIPRELLE